MATVLVGKENFQEQLAQGNDAFKSVFEAQLESYVDLADKKRDDIESKRQDIKKYKDLLSSNQTNMLEKAQKELARPGSELYKTYADNYVQEEELIVKLHNGGNNLFIRLKEELQKVFEKLVVGEQPGYYDKLVIGYLSEFKNESRSASRGGSVSSVSSGSDLYNSANGSYNFGSKVTVGDILNRDGIAAYFEIMSSDPSNGAVLNSEAYDKAFFGLEHRAQEVVKEFTSGEISKHTDKIRLGDDNHLATVYTSDVDGQPVRQIGGDRDQWLQKEFKTSVVDYLSIGDDGQVNSHAASHSARVSSRNSGPASR